MKKENKSSNTPLVLLIVHYVGQKRRGENDCEKVQLNIMFDNINDKSPTVKPLSMTTIADTVNIPQTFPNHNSNIKIKPPQTNILSALPTPTKSPKNSPLQLVHTQRQLNWDCLRVLILHHQHKWRLLNNEYP